MTRFLIRIHSIDDVKQFVHIVSSLAEDVDLASGRYKVDGKSIMGIFSLDLGKPIEMTVRGDDENRYRQSLEKFLV